MTVTRERIAVHVRWMIRRDMAEVLRTEELSFEFPWSEEVRSACSKTSTRRTRRKTPT